MGSNPSRFKGEDLPVENVSWNDCLEFCRKLTERQRAAGRLPAGVAYRLPTEAEWEYACRAGTTTRYYTGDSESDLARAGWYDGNSGDRTHPVGQKVANAFGLYDMHGNVWEWCQDWYGPYGTANATDPRGPQRGPGRVVRGGGWYYYARKCRSAYRNFCNPDNAYDFYGFRLVLPAGQ
jgi:formylglycine-generating enzyme required for sulfatase activity